MFCPAVFREDRPEVLHALIRAHPLATLITHGQGGLVANLIPFILVGTANGKAIIRAHLARANEQLDELRTATEALVVFQGPQTYVTPSWYETKREHGRAVPTWNYIAVQVRGCPRILEDANWLRGQLDALTEQQEQSRPEPWAVADAPESFIASQMRGIVGLEIPVDRIDGKWKVSQNQPAENMPGILAGLRQEDATSTIAAEVETRMRFRSTV